MRHSVIVSSCVAAVLLGLVSTGQADPVKIRVAWSSIPGSRGSMLTEKMDLLHHYGQSYTLDLIHFNNSPTELTALAAGELDIAQFTYPVLGAAIENAHMDDIRLIAQEVEDGPSGYATTHFTVLKDGPVKSVEDLKGKVVATNALGSSPDIAMRFFLRQHHLEDKRDYTDVEIAFPNMKAALTDHKVDLVSVIPPFIYDPGLLQIGRTLFGLTDAIGPSEGPMWAARAPYIQKNRAALVDLMEDALRSQRWYADPAHHPETVAIVARLIKQPPEGLDWIFTQKDFYRDPSGRPDLKAVASNLRMEKELGYLKTDIDVAKYADLSLVDEAAKRLDK